jgi:hypothetical protein
MKSRSILNGFELCRRVFASLSVLVICVGCGRRFTEDLAFQAPRGWVYAAVPNAGEVWVKPGESKESIMAQATDSPLPERQPEWKDITICGNHPAVLMIETNNPGQIWEGVSTNWGSERYMAVYVRPTGSPPDQNAEAAIRSLCLKKT